MEDGVVLELMEHVASHVEEVSRKDIVYATNLNQHTKESNVRDRQKRVLSAIIKDVQVGNTMLSHNNNP